MRNSLKRKVRILFLPTVDRDNTNAQSLNTREVALRLDPQRFEVTLLYQTEPDPRLRNRSHLYLQPLPTGMKTPRLFRHMLASRDLIAYVDFSPASYLFLHTPRIFRQNAKAILHVESTGLSSRGEAKLFSFLYAGIVPNCDAYTAITERVAAEVQGFLRRNISAVLPVGVDTVAFSPPLRRDDDRGMTVLFAGTLVARKNPLDVVRAARQFPTVKFRMVGPDRHGYVEAVRKEILASGVRNVALEGPKSQPELALAMRESDIFLLPSRVEGLPKVTLEAAASGLPCIVFRDYETPSVVDGVTGYQVETFEQMTAKLHSLICDRDRRIAMGAAARKHAEQFNWDIIAARWQEAYLQIAGQK